MTVQRYSEFYLCQRCMHSDPYITMLDEALKLSIVKLSPIYKII